MLHLDAIFVLGNAKFGLILSKNLMSIVSRKLLKKQHWDFYHGTSVGAGSSPWPSCGTLRTKAAWSKNCETEVAGSCYPKKGKEKEVMAKNREHLNARKEESKII
jgi:hypothetical protein